jgi:diadenosine tetraphosphate (Ap4A) HIT family hydrolase
MSVSSTTWELDAQLTRDTFAVGDLLLSRVLLMDDANYPWLMLVPRRAGAVELTDLDEADQIQLMAEIALASGALRAAAPCDKLNVAAIGNVVPQLHVHVVARSRDDPVWPKPVWGQLPARAYDSETRDRLIAALRGGLGLA